MPSRGPYTHEAQLMQLSRQILLYILYSTIQSQRFGVPRGLSILNGKPFTVAILPKGFFKNICVDISNKNKRPAGKQYYY